MELTSFAPAIGIGLLIVFLGLVVSFVYFTVTFVHHWGYYSFYSRMKRLVQWLYVGVSLLILAALGFFISVYVFGNGISS